MAEGNGRNRLDQIEDVLRGLVEHARLADNRLDAHEAAIVPCARSRSKRTSKSLPWSRPLAITSARAKAIGLKADLFQSSRRNAFGCKREIAGYRSV